MPYYNVKEANIFNEMEHYEIELELNNSEIKQKYGELGFNRESWGIHNWDEEENQIKMLQ